MYFFNSWHFVDLFFYMEEEMKYVYDILLNFNEKLYEFYEWMDDDYFDYIKRIGIIKVSKDTLIDIKTNKKYM